MPATPDRYLETPVLTNGAGYLPPPPSRVTSPNARKTSAPARETPHAPVKLRRILFIALILIAVGVVAGLVPRWHQRHVSAAEGQELAIGTVQVVKPAPGAAAEPIQLSGELRPVMEAPIYARASGYVRKWNFDLGAAVKEGTVLAELDTPETDQQLAEARATLRQAGAANELAGATAKRWKQMLLAKTVSAQEADEKLGDYAVKTQALAAAQANVERLEKLTGFGQLVAPFTGTITARRLDVGQLVNAGSGQELFRITDTTRLRVFVRVPQTFARSVRDGQKAEITLPELPGKKFEAVVVRSAGAMDAASRTLLTELEIDNANGELLAGSFVQVRLAETRPQAPLTVSSNCLIFRAEGPQVAVVNAQHRIELRKVTLGRDFGTTLEVLHGIVPEEQVVINPPDSLVDGLEVRVAEAPPAVEHH